MVANTSDENRHQEANNEDKNKRSKAKRKKERIRIFPIWLRVLVVLVLTVLALVSGLMFGYGVIGDGEAAEVLKKDTWQHIIDIVTKEK